MSVKIRLARMGRKNVRRYRIVAADGRMKRDGRFLDLLGTYDPEADPKKFSIDVERTAKWLKQGAEPSDTIRSLLKQDRFAERVEALGKGLDPATLNLERLAERKKRTKNRASKKTAAASA